jgi:hypothetical protein
MTALQIIAGFSIILLVGAGVNSTFIQKLAYACAVIFVVAALVAEHFQ